MDENIYICLPLHSNAGFYYVKILIPSNKKERKVINHGLNLEKLLLLTREEIDKYGSQSFIQNEVYKDIKKKENHIKNSTEKYLNEYIRIVKKYDNGNFLSNKEKNILMFSSLNAFYDKVHILKGKEKILLEYIYKRV